MPLPDNPTTRTEQYLAAIAGEGVQVPAPVSRTEQYLVYIAEHGGGGGGGGGGGSLYSPVGTIIAFMGTTAPRDYLACDGAVYNIADYSLLANHIATQFGSVNFFGGDGTTTFAVPDLRGEFLRGTGTNSHTGQGSGDSVGVHQDGTESPWVTYTIASSMFGVRTNSNAESDGWVSHRNVDSTPSGPAVTGRQLSWAGNSFPDANDSPTYTSRPTNTSVLYCIAYRDSMDDIVEAVLERLQGT